MNFWEKVLAMLTEVQTSQTALAEKEGHQEIRRTLADLRAGKNKRKGTMFSNAEMVYI